MAHREPIDITTEKRSLGDLGASFASNCFLVGVVALLLAVGLGYFTGPYGSGPAGTGLHRLQFAYLQGFMYMLSFTLGGLFFTMALYVTGGKWGVVVRRIPELAAANAITLAILALPILACVLFDSGLYEWTNKEKVHNDHLLHHKEPYLNPTFFTIRLVIYFGVWIFLGTYFLRESVECDTDGDPKHYANARKVGPVGLILFALTTTFAAFDLMMSLTPTWYSTIYGVVYFAGCNIAIYSFCILAYRWLENKGILSNAVTTEHYHDLGKLLFAFIVFWGYVAFSQYMLIWYANIPEETAFYRPRQSSAPWVAISFVLLIGHLLIPLPGVMSRWIKRDRKLLIFWAIWMLVAHWIEMYYNVHPTWAGLAQDPSVTDPTLNPIDPPIPFMEILCTIGIGGIWLGTLVRRASTVSLVPEKDPHLKTSLVFENF
jgi:hypothetical protein